MSAPGGVDAAAVDELVAERLYLLGAARGVAGAPAWPPAWPQPASAEHYRRMAGDLRARGLLADAAAAVGVSGG